MNVTVYIKNSTEKQIKNFKIGKNSSRGYFKQVLDGIRKFKGTVFVKYFKENTFKVACIVENCTVVVTGTA